MRGLEWTSRGGAPDAEQLSLRFAIVIRGEKTTFNGELSSPQSVAAVTSRTNVGTLLV